MNLHLKTNLNFNKMTDNNKENGIFSIGMILFLIFLTLKLAGIGQVANWSWWWITSPLWIPLALVIAISLIAILIVLIIKSLK